MSKRKKLCVLLAVMGIAAVGAACSKTSKKNVEKPVTEVSFELPASAEYKVGDVLLLPVPKVEKTEKIVSVAIDVMLNGENVAALTENDGAYRFDSSGEYSFVYKIETENEIKTDSMICRVVAGSSLGIDWLPEEVGRFEAIEIKDVYAEIGGAQEKATLTITCPSGKKETAVSGTFYCEEYGDYVFDFSVGKGEEKVTETKTVHSRLDTADLFSFTSGEVSKTSAAETPEGMGERNNSLKASGTMLTFKGDGSVRYNNVIDLNTLESTENLISLFAIPEKVPDYTGFTESVLPGEKYPSGGYTHGTANFTRFEIRLIDKYDSSNVVVISFWYMPCYSYWNWSEGYISVGNTSTTYALNNGKVDSAPYGSNYVGVVGKYSFFGEGNTPFNVQIDYKNKRFYSDTHGNGQKLILDYSDASLLGAANVWNGFTTGECYMELSFPMVTKESSVLVTEVLGTSLSEKEPAKINVPEIEVDTSRFENGQSPVAECGTAYKIPTATAFDRISGNCGVTVSVADESGENADIVNGGFTPTTAGTYIITYRAQNFFGIAAELSYIVEAVQKVEEITVSADETYEFFAGIETWDPEFTVSGGSGKKDCSIAYFLNGKEVNLQGGRLLFEEKGTLIIRFSVTDYLGTTETELTYNVTATASPVLESVVLPSAIYRGKEYVFPKASAYDYENDVAVGTDIFVNGKMLDKTRKYTPQSEDGEMLTVVYYAAANGETTSHSYTVRLIEYALLSHMFTEAGTERIIGERYAVLSAEKDFSVNFAYPVSTGAFALSLGGVQGEDKFSGVRVTLGDAADTKKTLIVTINPVSESKLNVKIGNETYSVSARWINSSNPNLESLSLRLSSDSVYITDGNSVLLATFPISTWSGGGAFSGFSSGGVYVSVKVTGVTGKASVKLFEFSGQTYTEYSAISSPKLALEEEITSGVANPGTNIRIPKAYGYSALSYKVSVKYKAIAPDGSTLAEGDGASGGYFTCNAYGMYTLNYYITDEINGMSETETYYFEVRDGEPPIVQVNENLGSAKVGKTFSISAPQVSDNLGKENCAVRVFVVDLNYNSVDVTSDMAYTPLAAGKYKVVYMAMDSAGNIGVATAYFTAA